MKHRRYTDGQFTEDDLRCVLAALRDDRDRFEAILTVECFRGGLFKFGLERLEEVAVSARLFRLIADEWEGKRPKGELTPTGVNIVRAWVLVRERYRKKGDKEKRCTAREVKVEYAHARGLKRPANQNERRWIAELEMQKKIPSDQTFRKTLALCMCELRKESD